MVGQGDLMFDIDQQVELVAEPLVDLVHLALVVLVFLLAACGLRQSLGHFLGDRLRIFLGLA